MAQKKQKKFSTGRVMDVPIKPLISIGMYKAITKHTDNISAYVRSLIMNDLKIDELGNTVK